MADKKERRSSFYQGSVAEVDKAIKKMAEELEEVHKKARAQKPQLPIQRNFQWKYSHEGLVCLCCGKVLISYHRYDCKTCGCPNEAMIDGGQLDYVRYGGQNMSLIQPVLIIPQFYTKNGKPSKKKIKTFREANNGRRSK